MFLPHGMVITLMIGFASVFASAIIGTTIGIVSGYYGGRLDNFIMRIMDVLLAFPGILLALRVQGTATSPSSTAN